VPKQLRTQAQRIRSTARWQRITDRFKREHPLCCDPFDTHSKEQRVEEVSQTHHILSVDQRPDLAYDWENLAPVCTECHGRLNSMEGKGHDTAPLFEEWRDE
jgi:5-methylcytosine-specific restriction endonuclease McrA